MTPGETSQSNALSCLMDVTYPYTRKYRDRHGKLRIEYRRAGRTIAIKAAPGTAEFQVAYESAKALFERGGPARDEEAVANASPNTLRWLCVEYFRSAEFEQLAPSTQRARRQVLEAMLREPTRPGSRFVFADFPLHRLAPEHVKVLRDRKKSFPQAANIRVKFLRGLLKWAIENNAKGGLTSNPARDVPKLRGEGDGYHAWTEQERHRFVQRHPLGSKAHLAFALLFHTGQRRSDVVLFGRQHVHNGKLRFTQQKNRRRKPISLELPILPELQAVLDVSPLGELTFLVTDQGKPFTVAGFGNWFRDRCNDAGLTKCSAHGLRKAAATVAAENGATAHELMSIFGWLTLQEAERYTRAAERKRLAERGMGRLVPIKPGTGSV